MRAQLLTLDHLVQLIDPALYLHLQSADSTNFFFFFRMLLVWYKREFEWPDVLRLWESLWTDYLSSNFHLFIALAILEKHRDVIMEHLKHFDEVLKYGTSPHHRVYLSHALVEGSQILRVSVRLVNELSNTIDLPSTLLRAQSLFRRFQRTVEAIDKKNNFPVPSIRQRKPAEPTLSNKDAKQTLGNQGKRPAGAGTGSDVRGARPGSPGERADAKEKVISDELRGLLSRKVVVLDKKAIVEHGGGL